MKSNCIMFVVIVTLILAMPAFADVPQLMNYQGRLTDSEGNPVEDGDYQLIFTIYDDPALGEPGNIKWQETHASVAITGGLFTVILGSNGFPVSEDVFSGGERYLGIKVGDDPEIVPRTRLVAGPYTFRSETADSATTIADNSVTSGKVAPGEVMTDDLDDGAVTSEKIQDGTILLDDLGDNGATEGDVMKWNGSAWETGGIQTTPIIWSGGPTTSGTGGGWITYGSNGVDFNTTAGYLSTNGSGIFTIETAGYYRINIWTLASTTGTHYAIIMKNGSSFHQNMQAGAGSNWFNVSMDVTWYFNIGDQLRIQYQETTGSGYAFLSWSSQGQYSRLQITYVGPLAP